MADKEEKFYVFNKKELDAVFDEKPLLKKYFETMQSMVSLNRIADNKKPINHYITCNQDEPYAEQVWNIIIEGEKAKANKVVGK